MSLIDDVKDSIGDGKYLELCNAMKKLYTSNESTTPTATPIEDIVEIEQRTTRNTLIMHDMYHSKYRLKKDRKLTINYGTTGNTYIPHDIILNNTSLKFQQREPSEEGNGLIYAYRISECLAYYVKLNFLTRICEVEIGYNGVVIFRSNDFIQKVVTHKKYNSVRPFDDDDDE